MFRFTALAAAFLLAGCDPAPPQPLSEGMIYTDGGAELDKARAEALRTLPTFWSKYYAKSADTTDFSLKVRLPTDDGGSEYFWAEPIRKTGEVVVVRLLNDPVKVSGVQYGSEVRAPLSEIWDWTYSKGGRAYGHFTTRVLLKEAVPEQRAQAKDFFSATPLEPDAK